jgi:hypothetical protein
VYARVAGGLDKVETSVNTSVGRLETVDTVLLLEVEVVARLNVLEDGLPALVVVHKVTKAGGVNDGELEPDTVLLNVWKSQYCMYRYRRWGGSTPAPDGAGGRPQRVLPDRQKRRDKVILELLVPASRIAAPMCSPFKLTGGDRVDADSLAAVASRLGNDLGLVELGLEEGVDEGRLAEA